MKRFITLLFFYVLFVSSVSAETNEYQLVDDCESNGVWGVELLDIDFTDPPITGSGTNSLSSFFSRKNIEFEVHITSTLLNNENVTLEVVLDDDTEIDNHSCKVVYHLYDITGSRHVTSLSPINPNSTQVTFASSWFKLGFYIVITEVEIDGVGEGVQSTKILNL